VEQDAENVLQTKQTKLHAPCVTKDTISPAQEPAQNAEMDVANVLWIRMAKQLSAAHARSIMVPKLTTKES